MSSRQRSGDPLAEYHSRRDFGSTPEPRGKRSRSRGSRYLVQKHAARRMHYDLRLELDGVLKSWAVTKGPSLDPAEKRLAVRTEDHPVEYGDFEGVIPDGYGAGTVLLWDTGRWVPQGNPEAGLRHGKLEFTLQGDRLKGGFVLVRMKSRGREKRENWLLIKKRDAQADDATDPARRWTRSVVSGRDLAAIEHEASAAGRSSTDTDPARPARGRAGRQKMPKFIAPQLATLRSEPPGGEAWLHEIKYDGYRLQALKAGDDVRLMTRNAKDWTDRYPSIARSVAGLAAGSLIVDGEVVALDAEGRTDFGALQNARSGDDAALVYYAFDLLAIDGRDLRKQPLQERKKRLRKLIGKGSGEVRYSDHVLGNGEAVIARACGLGLEGIVSKQADGQYRSGRTTSWIKSKCIGRDEFVIGGYRRSSRPGRAFASLLLGEYTSEGLVYRGRVGTGFDDQTLQELGKRLNRLRRSQPAFVHVPAVARREAVWVEPELLAQIAYTERTADGVLRHPSFQGLREDKTAREMKQVNDTKEPESGAALCGVRLTHPDKVLYRDLGLTKRELAEYYLDVAPHMLPHLAGRPVSLVRCPAGRTGHCFFQKHFNQSTPEHLRCIEITEKGGAREPYLVIDDEAALVAAAQIGALELHVWGARADRIERPERIVFDLDPGPDVAFAAVRAAAVELRDLLAAAGLETFALLTGGKGIHVIAPLTRRNTWAEVKSFSRDVAQALARAAPDRYVASASKARRKGRIFIDWLRNERGATAIVPYAARARAGAPVAVPVAWDALSRINAANEYDVHGVRRRLARLSKDPWPDYFELRQSLTRSIRDTASSLAGS